MNTHSFEYDLRNLEAPAPDPAAHECARRAALEEFERLRAMPPSVAAKGGVKNPPSRWNPRSARWSGLAAACVAVAGVGVYWLLPPNDRIVRLDRSPAPALSAATAAPELREDTQASQPTEAPISPRAGQVEPSRPTRRKSIAAPAYAAQMDQPPVSAAEPAVDAGTSQQMERKKSEAFDTYSTALTNMTDKPVPPPPMAPPLPASAAAPGSGSARINSSAAQENLEEAVVTVTRRLRPGLFSRRDVRAETAVVPAPAVENRDRFRHFETNAVKRVTDEPVSTFSVDVDTASYSFVRRQLNAGTLPQADAVRVEEMINYFDYGWPVPESREQPFRPTVTVSDSPWSEGRKLVHIGIKGYALPASRHPDVNLVLLLDVSGSMNSPDKLPLAQRSMALLLDSLKPTDTVAIVVYAGAAGQVLAPTPARDKARILEALYSLRPGGSTAGAAGIQLAYALAEQNFRKDGVNRILLATDGDFNVGITDQEQLKRYVEREREKGVYLSVLGFGQGNYRDEMAQTLAQNGNGVAAYIDTLDEARKVLVEQSTAALFTIAKDVKLQVEFNPATVAEYRLVGYETRSLNREDFNNDKVDAGDVGAGHTVTAIYEITPVEVTPAVDESRYAARVPSPARRGKPDEYGYLKIRYKLPSGLRSRLMEVPIRTDAGVPANLRQDVAFSTAVAGFAQLLRGGRYTGALGYDDVLRQAEDALGEDSHGYRSEFLHLVRLAQQAR
jgi:Ca-activated chloride channel family protein